jgi:hypothetical protein
MGEQVVRVLPALRRLQLLPVIRVTPAMEAGIADHVWTLAELLV